VIVDPGKDVENRKEVSILIEKRLSHPILQIAVGRFLASYDDNLLGKEEEEIGLGCLKKEASIFLKFLFIAWDVWEQSEKTGGD
jgi:hypothetical protein